MSRFPRAVEFAPSQSTQSAGPAARLDDDPWDTVAKKLRSDDEAKIKDCKEDIDTLLVFAGLFSAVLTAFNVEIYQTLQQDSSDVTSAALVQISRQIKSLGLTGGDASSNEPAFVVPSFAPPSSAIRINIMWFSALVLSLASASLSMLVKQWLRAYLSREYTAAVDRIRLRHYHYKGLIKWRVFELAAMCPLLLQVSFILFFAGLSDFLIQLNHTVGFVVTALIAAWLLGYTASIICPMFSYRCPYKSPLFKNAAGFPKRILTQLVLDCRPGPLSWFLDNLRSVKGDYEKAIRRDVALDLQALIQADAEVKDDEFLPTLRKCLKGARAPESGPNAVAFVRSMLSHRLDRTVMSLAPPAPSIEFGRLSTRALLSSIDIVSDALETVSRSSNREQYHPWMGETLSYLFTALDHAFYVKRTAVHRAADRAMDIRNRLSQKGGVTAEVCERLVSNTRYIPGVKHSSSTNYEPPAAVVHEYQEARDAQVYSYPPSPGMPQRGIGPLGMPSMPEEGTYGHTQLQHPPAAFNPGSFPYARAPGLTVQQPNLMPNYTSAGPFGMPSVPVQAPNEGPRPNRTGRRGTRAVGRG